MFPKCNIRLNHLTKVLKVLKDPRWRLTAILNFRILIKRRDQTGIHLISVFRIYAKLSTFKELKLAAGSYLEFDHLNVKVLHDNNRIRHCKEME